MLGHVVERLSRLVQENRFTASSLTGNPHIPPVLLSTGITAASGIAAELGIPLTHRGLATSVRFLTGHARDGNEATAELDSTIAASADPHTTLVVYMGLSTLPLLVCSFYT